MSRRVELAAGGDPLFNNVDLCRRERIVFLRHADGFITRDDAAEQLGGVRLAGHDGRLARLARLLQVGERVQPIVAFDLDRPVTTGAAAGQDRRHIAQEADFRG